MVRRFWPFEQALKSRHDPSGLSREPTPFAIEAGMTALHWLVKGYG